MWSELRSWFELYSYGIGLIRSVTQPLQVPSAVVEQNRYDSLISKKIVSWTQLILIYACYKFYDLFYKAYNPPQAEDLRNQLQKPESYFFDFLF